MAVIGALIGGCAGAKYEPQVDRQYTIDTGGQVFGRDDEWKEAAFSLPAYPQDADLLQFESANPAYNTHFVDEKSLSIGPDGVVRYSLVVKTPAGVDNISFEGIRCEERQWKAYAFGRRGEWVPARNPQWRTVARQSLEDFRFALYRDYFCPDGFPRRNTEEIVAFIKRQFQAGPLQERK